LCNHDNNAQIERHNKMLFQCLAMLNEYLNYKEKKLKNTPMCESVVIMKK
jgi:hypothetical protein